MRRSVTLAASALAALALATTAGCSSTTKGSASTEPITTTTAAGAGAGSAAGAGASTGAATSKTSAPASAAAQSGGSGGVAACSLLTAAQATSLNNVTYTAASPGHPANGYDTCTYKNGGSPNPVDIQDLNVAVLSIPGCWSALQSSDGPGKALSGVGDAAFGASIGIDIKVGSRCITIQGLTEAELQGNYAPDIAMGKIIVAKLG
jgi:hypothetical protein